jgi:hypothetical protein
MVMMSAGSFGDLAKEIIDIGAVTTARVFMRRFGAGKEMGRDIIPPGHRRDIRAGRVVAAFYTHLLYGHRMAVSDFLLVQKTGGMDEG